ncbi:unnamed protein product [Hyaloperonospora brassicae]|uniref:RxLR effector candidate protein n=1 Tax=Hyaloperonospora brassicae TaxID=162125 RepID=A0AAV0TIW2_HYABA|nr:unnamed protein product [Hyaloperonospora brassicae]
MGRREDEGESSRRHGRRKSSPSAVRGQDNEDAIRNKLREAGWKKRRTESESDGEPFPDKDVLKGSSASRGADEYRSARASSRRSRHSHSPRRREREHHLTRRKSSGESTAVAVPLSFRGVPLALPLSVHDATSTSSCVVGEEAPVAALDVTRTRQEEVETRNEKQSSFAVRIATLAVSVIASSSPST